MPNPIRLSVACTLLLSAVLGLSTSTHAATLADMRNVGTMSFCLNPEAMPYSQRDAGENSPGNGYLYELSIELIKRLQLSPRVVWLNSLERLKKTTATWCRVLLLKKKIWLSSVAVSKKIRRKFLIVSSPYLSIRLPDFW